MNDILLTILNHHLVDRIEYVEKTDIDPVTGPAIEIRVRLKNPEYHGENYWYKNFRIAINVIEQCPDKVCTWLRKQLETGDIAILAL